MATRFVFDPNQWWQADAIRQEREDLARQRAMEEDYKNASMRLYNEGVQRQNALARTIAPSVTPAPPVRNALAAGSLLDTVGGDPGLPPRGWQATAVQQTPVGLATNAPVGTPGLPPTEGVLNYVPEEFRRDELLQRAQQTTKNPDLPLTSQQQTAVLPEVRTWGEYQAVMQNAQMMSKFYEPMLKVATETQNTALLAKIAEQYDQVPIPLFKALGGMMRDVKFNAEGESELPFHIRTEADLQAFKLTYPTLQPWQLPKIGDSGSIRAKPANGKTQILKYEINKDTTLDRKDTGGGVEITPENYESYRKMLDANPAFKNYPLKIGKTYDFSSVDGMIRGVTPTKEPVTKADSFKTVVTVGPENRAALEAASGEKYKDGTKLSVTKTGDKYTEIVPVKEEKPQTQTQAFVLSPESRSFLASKIRPNDAAARASLNSFKVDGKTEVTAEFDSEGFVRSIGKAGTAPGISVAVKTSGAGDVGTGLFAGTWDSPEGQFGQRAKNKPVFENQIVLWMQALSKNPNARLFSAQGQRGAVLDSEAKQRVSDYMVDKGIPPEALVDAGAARSALPALKKQQANLEANAQVAEGGFVRVKRLREQGGVSTSFSPLVNKTINILRNWTGDEYPKAAQGVLTEVLVDYAKVISGQTSTAGVTAYAAKLAEGLLPLSDNPAQFERKLREYEGMMKTRLDAQRRVIDLLSRQAGMKGGSEPEDTGVHPWGHSVPPKAGMTLQGGKVVDKIFYNKKTKQYGVTYVR